MVENRNDDRIVFISMGLVDGKTEKISCVLENISPAGALIRMSGPVPETIQKGDIVHLKAILLLPVELQCKVVRIDADQIAMQFINM
ncbi:MAG: PilZ domain-containing protein [Desulfuromonadaceae bacterium]